MKLHMYMWLTQSDKNVSSHVGLPWSEQYDLKAIVELHLAYSYSTFSFLSSALLTCPLFIAFFWLTATEYPSGFFSDLQLLNTPLVSFLTYGYWIPLWFLFWLTATEYPSGFFSDLQLLNTPMVSFLTYGYWIPLWFLQTFLHWYWSIYCTSRHIFHYDIWWWAINNIE